ncbi:MAG: hydroxymethylglutaryl-CoA reductase [Gammaproteobacteria bacterium]|nr:hydroxymethylglutaryl-CoA reductase [Gammaproteobacteria bacterium]
MQTYANIPIRTVGAIRFSYAGKPAEEIRVPLATLETPLWHSVNRGARLSRMIESGIVTTLIKECMTRSILFDTKNAATAYKIQQQIEVNLDELKSITQKTSDHTKLIDIFCEIVGRQFFLRLSFTTGDAAGHNMATAAAQEIQNHLLQKHKELSYLSISANICVDKKNSAINSILGRGKHVAAEIFIPQNLCELVLKTTPEKIVELNNKKNLLGSILAGSICSANAHYANMLLAFYLATGQDAANIVEGSQGITSAELINGELYFSVNLPNIIIGTIGTGKNLPYAQNNLKLLGCQNDDAKKLASIAAATVLCGELSLLAAQSNPGELMRAHKRLERKR